MSSKLINQNRNSRPCKGNRNNGRFNYNRGFGCNCQFRRGNQFGNNDQRDKVRTEEILASIEYAPKRKEEENKKNAELGMHTFLIPMGGNNRIKRKIPIYRYQEYFS